EFLLKQLVAAAESPPVERHLTWFGALGPDRRTLAWPTGLLDRFPADGGLNRLLWLDFLSYLPDNLPVTVDRRSMLASPEARATTARLLAEHRAGKSNNARKLWPILMAELWAERWNVEIG